MGSCYVAGGRWAWARKTAAAKSRRRPSPRPLHTREPVSPPWGASMSSLDHISRRALLRAAGALAAGALPGASWAQQAGEPPAAAEHRFAFAGQELAVLSDGHLVVPTRMLAGNVPPGEVRSYLASHGLGPDRVDF